MYKATLRGLLWVPYDALGDVGKVREILTFQPRRKMDGERPDPIQMYYDDPGRGLLGVPQAWGRESYPGLGIVDKTTTGEEMNPGSQLTLPDPNHPAVADPASQAKFMEDVRLAAENKRRFMAVAPTGTGKTVVGAGQAVRLGRKTLVLTHMHRLNEQWVEAFQMMGMPMGRIGMVGEGKCIYHDKDVVVGTLQTVAREVQGLPKDFYECFGTVLFDECHRLGAPMFGQAAWQFPARWWIALTATDKRKDGADLVFKAHIGAPSVYSQQQALPMEVWPVWYESGSKIWGTNHGSRVKCLTQDYKRNQRAAKLVKKMYDSGRQAIIVSEHVAHLETVREMVVQLGVPKEVTGLFVSEYAITKRIAAGGRYQEVKRKKKTTVAELANIKENSTLIFATYGMIKEGVDIPRLDAGIDITPRSDGTQLVGRIRRPHPNKKQPVLWVTLVDVRCDRSLRYYESRLRDYKASGAEVKSRDG